MAPRRFFISYAHGDPKDEGLATFLQQGLSRAGHDVFIDVAMPLGARWAEEIETGLASCDFMIVLLSANADHSEMVLEEVRLAYDRRRQTGAPAFLPVRVDYDESLSYALNAYLNPYQQRRWRTAADSPPLLAEIIQVAADGTAVLKGDTDNTVSQPPEPSVTDWQRPQPQVDLSGLVMPGGALRTDDPYYIARSVDAQVLQVAHRTEETLIIKAPRQMGKSSLLKRYLLACQQAGKRIALIDLSLFPTEDLADYSRFLSCLVQDLLIKLELDVPPGVIRSQADLTYFLQRSVLKPFPGLLVVAFDEVDRVLGQAYQADFFSMLRYWHERRTDVPPNPWARMELALVISTEPYLLIEDANRSPFNVRPPIELQPFNREECRQLNRCYHDFLSESQVETLRELVGGHPFLTRLAYYRLLSPGALSFSRLLDDAPADHGPFGDHLRALLARLKQCTRYDLVAAMRQVGEQRRAALPEAIFQRLLGAGLVRREGPWVAPANLLYGRFFGALP